MKLTLLASGSKGNCCLAKHKDTQLAIDCGTTRKYLKSCFEQTSCDPMQSNAFLTAHTHSDHIVQVRLLDLMPTYVIQDITTNHLHGIHSYSRLKLQDSRVTVLLMSHDCEDVVGYVIETEDEKMVHTTSTGYIKSEAKEYIHNADYCVFESSRDIRMLMQTARPVYLEQYIIGSCGHLYSEDCSNTLCDAMGDHIKEIVLAHISQERNTWDIALTTLKETLERKQKDRENLRLYPTDQFSIYTGRKLT